MSKLCLNSVHETARCIGYPSDSTRAARERGRGAACGHRLRRPGPVRPAGPPPPPSPPLAPVAQACLSPLWLNSVRRRASPTSHWPWVSSRAAYRRARSPARIATVVLAGCSGAGSGWCCRAWIAVCTVSLGGPATVGAGPLMCADSWAVTVWRIASAVRLRQSRGHRTERGHPVSHQHGTTAVALSAKFGVRGVPARPMPGRGR